MGKVLIVDDDSNIRRISTEILETSGFSAIQAQSGKAAIQLFEQEKPEVVLLDLKMPEMDGIETMRRLSKLDPSIPIIIITAHGDVPAAVNAIKLGAYDFINKPPDFEKLLVTLQRATEKVLLDRAVKDLSHEIQKTNEYLCGKSPAMKKVIDQIHQISKSNLSLIIQGETGTGKSFIARYIHNLSKRENGPFVSVDIGSMPETMVESELFGHEKGAFTGAEKKKKGFFEIADGGTLLIDELQNISMYVQGKLLAAAEEKSIYPLGSRNPVKSDVRIIGATNKNILQSVNHDKSFRQDLYYRLAEFMIELPPLRERTEDIPFFADKFCWEASEDINKEIYGISEDAMDLLIAYSWPGNIRELKNVIKRAVLCTDENIIDSEQIAFLIKDTEAPERREVSRNKLPSLNLVELEKIAIREALAVTNNNKTKAAAILNISYMTLLRKIKSL